MKNHIYRTVTIFIILSTLYSEDNLASNLRLLSTTGKISGFVTDRHTGQSIPDANIILLNTRFGTASQDGGYFFIGNIPPGKYDIAVRVIGYENVIKRQVLVGSNTVLDFALIPEIIQLDPVLVTATRSDHLQSMVTVSSEVLTPHRLKEQTGNTVGEVTESLGGIYTKNYDGLAGPQTPSIRGANTDQVLILLDDQRLNTAQGGGVDLNVFPVEAIQRVEVVKGGHSTLLGTDAIGGVIHLVSKESNPLKGFSYGIHSTMGSFGTQMITLFGSHRIGPFSYFLSYNKTHSNGNFRYNLPDTGEEKTRENNDYDGNNIFLKTKLELSSRNQLRFLFQSLKTERGVIGAISWTSPEARRNEDRRLFSLQSENQLSSQLRLKEQIYYHTYNNHYVNPGAWIPEDDLHKNMALGFDLQGQWNIKRQLVLTSGIELRQDRLKSTKFTELERNTHSFFVQAEMNHPLSIMGVPTQWKWIPALRWSNTSDVEARTCPKLGMLLSTGDETSISLRGNIGQSYRVPSFNDLYWPEDDFTKGNPGLAPEISTNFDMGLILRKAHSPYFQIETVYFHNDFEDLILWAPGDDSKWTPHNMGRAIIQGLENTLTLRLPNNRTYVTISHTQMKATDETPNSTNNGNRLIYRPDTKIDISAGVNAGPIFVNLNYRIVGKRFTNPDNSEELSEYSLLNGNIGGDIPIGKIHIDAKFQALNLLDKSITILDGYPLPGREYRFSLGFEY